MNLKINYKLNHLIIKYTHSEIFSEILINDKQNPVLSVYIVFYCTFKFKHTVHEYDKKHLYIFFRYEKLECIKY